MKTKNETILGFDSISDYLQTMTGGNKPLTVLLGILGGISSFITGYIYESAGAIYFLLFLMGCDLFTAIVRSLKDRTFSSRRLPRIFVTMITYVVCLAIGFNAAKFSPMFNFLPGALLFGFYSVAILSIFENLVQLDLLPKSVYQKLRDLVTKKG